LSPLPKDKDKVSKEKAKEEELAGISGSPFAFFPSVLGPI